MNSTKMKQGLHDPKLTYLYIRNKFQVIVSKLVFKNTAGFNNNVKGRLELSKAQKINIKITNKQKNKLAEEFRDKGYVKIGTPYDPKLIKRISDQFNEVINDDRYSYVRANDGDTIYSRSLYRGHEIIPESIELLNDEIIDLIEQYYRSHFKVVKFAFWRNSYVPSEVANNKKEQMSSRWHCDVINTSWVKLFVYLTDVTEDDGPFHVQTGNRTKELMKLGYKNRNNYNLSTEVLENEKFMWKATGKIGTALMCNCNLGMHRAGIPSLGHHRDMLQFQLAPSTEPLPKDWYKTFVDPNEPIKPHDQHSEPIEDPNT